MTSPLRRLNWIKNRLAAMSAAEIVFRLREAARRKIDEVTSAPSFRGDDEDLPRIPGLCEGLDAWDVPQDLLQQWRDDARGAQAHQFHIFGRDWSKSMMGNIWHLDPVSGQYWPHDVFCFAIDYRHASDKGDIKYVWEINRLQYLQSAAALAYKTKDVVLAQFCLNEVESWINDNPPYRGINWNSGIELALRAISILVITSFIGEQSTAQQRSKINTTLWHHARWIARYPSRYSSANNHRVAEGLGLLAIGALCPAFSEATEWRDAGWDILCDAAERQILPDGASAEQAIAYAASVLETLLLGFKIAQTVDLDTPDNYLCKITLGGEYLRWLTDKGGYTPHIGDDDNACVIGEYHDGDHYATSVLACIAALTDRADLTPPNLQPHLRQTLFGQPPAPDFTPYGARQFAHGGMTIGRHASSRGDVLLAFDHGYLGYLSIAAHGHADALSLWLHIGDQPIFVDAGTYLYHAAHDERSHFRSTAAHNTLAIGKADSSIMAGNFNWSHKAQTRVTEWINDGSFWRVGAEHDGYEKRYNTHHRRSLTVSPASGVVIEDFLTTETSLPVTISFLLHPALMAQREGNDIMILKGETLIVRLQHNSTLTLVIDKDAYYSPSFGVKQKTTQLSFQGDWQPGQKAVTKIYWSA